MRQQPGNSGPIMLSDHDKKDVQTAQVLAIQYFKAGNMTEALTNAKKAADIDTQNASLQNLVGAISQETKDPNTAVYYLNRSLSIAPHQVEAQYLLGNAYSALSKYEEALECYNAVIAIEPGHTDAIVNQGFVYTHTGQQGKAERAFTAALRIDPAHAVGNNALADICFKKTQFERAVTFARQAIETAPDQVEFHLTLARALRHLNRNPEAEDIYRAALQIHAHNPTLIVELGSTLRDQNLFDEAEEHYKNALEIAPKNARVLRGAGAFYQSISRFEEALDAYQRYIAIKPDDAGMLNNLAIIMRDLNRFEESEHYYLECVKREQEKSYVYNNLGILAMEMGKPEESIRYYGKALSAKPGYSGAHSNMLFYMNYLSSMSAESIFEEHKGFATMQTEPLMEGACVHGNDLSPDRKLKIGYVSADFYGHAVSYFIEPALKHHDPEKFEIYCYANLKKPDGITKRLRGYVSNWHYIHALKAEEVADLVRGHEIDILVDLGGHTAGNRLDVFALKPAPVQVTWIGYPNTTGLETVDYRFVDPITDPPGLADEVHTEKLWRLPRSFTCYNPQSSLPVSRELAAKKTGQMTFGSFNNASKLSPATIEAWAAVLDRAEGSRLILKSASLVDKGTQSRLFEMFESHGVSRDRVEMRGKLSSDEHMRLYDSIDIALDPFPYNGTTTSCEALYMGVPIVALLGDRHAARVTGSLLHQVGLEDLVADSVEDYVNKAVELASDLDRVENIRVNLRDNMLKSPLCDQPVHTRDVEEAYREMWKIWITEEPARRQQRKQMGRPETKRYKPLMRLVHSLGNGGFVQFCKCLSVMKDVRLLNDLHPLGMLIFPPYQQANNRFRLFDSEEFRILTTKPQVFDKSVARIRDKLSNQNRHMVITDWCHLDFVAQPYLPVPACELAARDALQESFDLREVFITCHPDVQWAAYLTETTIGQQVSPEEFLYGYRRFAEFANDGTFYKIEDFGTDPTPVLKSVCQDLEIDFNAGYDDEWPFSADAGGDPHARPLEARATEEIKTTFYKELPEALQDRMQDNADHAAILKLLDYT